jgi:hypothetical protein
MNTRFSTTESHIIMVRDTNEEIKIDPLEEQ